MTHSILIVEDEFIVSMEIEERLAAMEYRVAGSTDTGERAVELVNQLRPDLVLMDISLKGEMDGITAAEEIRRRFQVPIIFLTAYSEDSTLERAKLSEPYGYILKPFDDRELKSIIEISLHRHRAEKEIRRLNRLYDVLSQVNQAVVRIASRDELLQTVCRLIVERGVADLTWIDWLEPGTGKAKTLARFGEHSGLPREARCDGDAHCRPRQTPFPSFPESVLVGNDNSGKLCPQSLDCGAARLGFRSCGSFPIHFQGHVAGMLHLGIAEPDFFQEPEVELLNKVCMDLSFALEKQEADAARDRAMRELRTSEATFRSYIEHAPLGIFVADSSGRYLDANPAAMAMLGYSEAELLGMSLSDTIAPELLQAGQRHLHTAVETGSAAGQYCMRRQDGAMLWASVSAAKIDANHFLAFCQDITEQRKAVEMRLESEERLRLFIEHAPAALAMFDREMRYLSASRRWLDDYSLGNRDLTGLSHYEVFPEIPQYWKEVHRRGMSGEVIRAEEDRFERADGSVQWQRWEVRPWRDSTGKVGGILIFSEDITQRKQIEETIAERERFLRTILETTVDGFWVTEGEGRFIDVNDAYCRMTGYSQAELLTMGISDVEALEEPAAITARIRRVNANGSERFETRHRRKDGSVFDVQVSVTYLNIGRGQFVCFCNDISERKRHEAALRHSEERYRLLVETANEGIWTMDAGHRTSYVNEAMARMLDYTPFEMFGMKVEEFFFPEDMPFHEERMQNRHAGKDEVYERRCKKRDGTSVWALVSAKAKMDDNGRFAGSFAMFMDITERKRAEEALRESEAQLQAMFDIASVGITQAEPATRRWVRVNRKMSVITGYSRAELLEMSAADITHPEDRARDQNAFADLMHGRVKDYRLEKRYLRKDGTTGWVSVNSTLTRDAVGQPVYTVSMIEDITERKHIEDEKIRIEAQLRQAQKMEAIGHLAGGIAHDFNNILSAIIGFTEMALDKAPQEGDFNDDLQEVLSAGLRAKELVKQILTFSRQTKREPKPVEVTYIVKEAVKMLRAMLPSTIQILQENTASPQSRVLADPTEIHQVIMNLCTNAAHAMRENGGNLDIELREVACGKGTHPPHPDLVPGNYLRLRVSDTGHGMSQEVIAQIFDPFFTTKDKGEGTGMGLSVLHGIVKSCNGAVTVESKEKEGATFCIYFPAVTNDKGETVGDGKALTDGKGRILFVDDEKSLTTLGQRMLERLGYMVTTVNSGKEALEILLSNPFWFDLLITDYTMPQMTGLDLAEKIKRIRPTMPVILCSGFNDKVNEANADSFGVDMFVPKPFDIHKLSQGIKSILADGRKDWRSPPLLSAGRSEELDTGGRTFVRTP